MDDMRTYSLFEHRIDPDVLSHNIRSDDPENEKIIKSEMQILDVTTSAVGSLYQGDCLLVSIWSYIKTNLNNEDEKYITIKLLVDRDVRIPVQFENLKDFVSLESGSFSVNKFKFWEQ